MLCQGWRSHMFDLYKAIFRELPLLEKKSKTFILVYWQKETVPKF